METGLMNGESARMPNGTETTAGTVAEGMPEAGTPANAPSSGASAGTGRMFADRADAAGTSAAGRTAADGDAENAPIVDWSSVELGLPDGVADAEVLADFGKAAVDMGLTPKQARALAHWQTEQIARSREQLLERGSRELAREWGGKMQVNQQAVLSLISRIDRLTGDDIFSRALGESGATCFPGVVRGLLAVSRALSEDSVGAGGGAAQAGQDESTLEGLQNALRAARGTR